MHHLRPVEVRLNSSRGNNLYGVVSNRNSYKTYAKYGSNETYALGGYNNNGVFEPLDNKKGDVARIILYTYLHYNSYSVDRLFGGYAKTNGSGSSSYFKSSLLPLTNVIKTSSNTEEKALELLLDWNTSDPVDEIEQRRNEQVAVYQGNRNPFIDNPSYANAIWGGSTPSATLTLSKTSTTIEKGNTETITATPSESATIKWESNDTSVATVTNSGKITAVAKGVAVLTATATIASTQEKVSAQCTVTVTDSESGGGDTGDTITASVSISSYATAHSWSNETKYTSVSLDSVVTANASGGSNTGKYYTNGNEWRFYQSESATITISLASGYELVSATFTYNVNNGGVLKDSSSNSVLSGSEVSVSGSTVTFAVGNSGSATNGQVKFTAISVTYRAKASTVAVTGVSLNETILALNKDDIFGLVATVEPVNASNKSVTWESSDISVATVSNGTVTAKANGNTTITVTTTDGSFTATCEVVVTTSVTGVTLNKSSIDIAVGGSETLTATINPSGASNTEVEWFSDDEDVATVEDGVVSGIAEGTTTITVVTDDGGFSDTCEVTVSTSAVTYDWSETAITDLTSSDEFVIVGDNGSTYAMSNNNGTSNPPAAVAVTVSQGKITSAVADSIKWTISGNGTDGYVFYPYGSSTTWLYCTNGNNGVRVGTNENNTFTIDGGYLKHVGTSRYVGVYNSQDWRCYTSSSTNINNQTFKFYKKTAGSPTPVVTTYTVTYNANGGTGTMTDPNSPYNENAQVTVLNNTFTYADHTFVKWNTQANGQGTDYAEGAKFTITANVTLFAQWEEDSSSSQEVDVTPTDGQCFYKISSTSELLTGKYLIVYETGSVAFNGGIDSTSYDVVSNNVSVTIRENKTIAYSSTLDAATFTYDTSTKALKSAAGYYISRTSNSTGINASTSPDGLENSITFAENGDAIIKSDNNNYVLRYNANSDQKRFRYYSGDSVKSIQLYRLYDAEKYSKDFLAKVTCSGSGSITATGTFWSDMSSKYTSNLSSTEQGKLTSGVANMDGTTYLARALARYDAIVSKYGTNTYANFMNRNIPSAGLNILVLTNNNTSSWLIIVISVISLSVISLYIFKRRKKYDN